MRVVATVEGGEELRAKLKQLQIDVAAALAHAAETGAEIIESEARRRAPGPHIETQKGKVSKTRAEYLIGPDDDHWYYRFFETGAGEHEIGPDVKQAISFEGAEGAIVRRRVDHPGMDAEPFLRPAIDSGKAAATNAVGKDLKAAIDRVARG